MDDQNDGEERDEESLDEDYEECTCDPSGPLYSEEGIHGPQDQMQMVPNDEELSKREKEFQELFGAPEQEPIEARTSEAEKLYANLLMKTDFERDFIEEMLEYEPDAESEERIQELRQKRRDMEEMMKNGGPPPMMGGPPMGGGGMDMIVI